ncbi:MAG: ADP-ribosylglycohydrolase family protein [Geminicoccaceae bacterium]|nr:MAG: ADP-ribosylglycohydrolase family protein [Geminicoccaceae bacterium]
MPTRTSRISGALQGQFIGDALCLGSHWIYNLRERARLFPAGIEGFEPPAHDHYHKGRVPGDGTHYADAAQALLASVAERGGLDARDYGRRLVAVYGDPAFRGYLDKPTRILLEREREWRRAHPGEAYAFDDGAADEQTVTHCRLAPVVIAHAQDADLAARIEAAVRVCQNHDRAVAHALVYADLLRRALDGEALGAAVEAAVAAAPAPYAGEIAQRLDDAKAMIDLPAIHATGEVGRSCYLPNTFPAMLHVLLRHGDDPETALLESVRAGGDNASRTAVLGAWLGAFHGTDAWPATWWARLTAAPRLEPLIDQLAERFGGD